MFSNRLEQTLNARIQLIQNLLLIYSYSELVNLRVQNYQKDNQNIYQKEMLLLESYQHFFKIDEKFTKMFYSLVCRIFNKLNKNFKASATYKSLSNKIKVVYFEFVSFFKLTNEYQIVRYLQKVELDAMTQNQLFFLLTSTLIKYMKLKTDSIILKLKDKSKKQDLDFYEEKSIQFVEVQRSNNFKKRPGPSRKGLINTSRNKFIGSSLTSRRYNSEELPKLQITSRRYSKDVSGKSSRIFDMEKIKLQVKDISNVNWKVGSKKFKEVFVEQWNKYYELLTPMIEDLEQLKFKNKIVSVFHKKQWTSTHYSDIFYEIFQRNESILKSINSLKFRQVPYKRKSVQKILRL